MKQHGVYVDFNERKNIIKRGVIQKARSVTQNIDEETFCDEALLCEVNFLVENPLPVLGNFDKRFLSLPKDVLETAMKHHQRYFPVVDRDGKIYPNFVWWVKSR